MKGMLASLILIVISCLCGCSNSQDTIDSHVDLKSPYYEAYALLDRGEIEEAENAFRELADSKDYPVLMGLGKALFEADKYEEALSTFEEASILYPEEITPVMYQGALYEQMADYDNAADCYDKVADRVEFREAFELKIRLLFVKIEDREKAYQIFRKIYLRSPDSTRDLNNYMMTLAYFDSDEKEKILLKDVAGSRHAPYVKVLIESYHLATQGDLEAAKTLLFDPSLRLEDLERSLVYARIGQKAKEQNPEEKSRMPDGMYISLGANVFGSKGATIRTSKQGLWEGVAMVWKGSVSNTSTTVDGIEYKGTRTQSYTYDIMMEKGVPQGIMHEEYIYWYNYPERKDYLQVVNRETTDFQMIDGKAEGDTVTVCESRSWDESEWKKRSYQIRHSFHNGKPQQFNALTKDGEKDVFEVRERTDGRPADYYKESECNHVYIW